MTGGFVKKTVKYEIQSVIDGKLPNRALLSIEGNNERVNLVIGAFYKDRHACLFSKWSLGLLIETLQEIHEAMEE